MSDPGAFDVDGVSDLRRLDPRYRAEALEVFAGEFTTAVGTQSVELRAVPPDAPAGAADAFGDAAQQWWQVRDHDTVVDLLRWGRSPRPWVLVGTNGTPTLADAWDQLTEEAALYVIADVADALSTAGETGVAHGNLRPATVRVDPSEPRGLVDDWGLGRAVAAADGGFVTGFTAPEQLDTTLGGSATTIDTYGLAALTFFVLGEVPPFPEDAAAIRDGTPRSLSDAQPGLADPVRRTILHGLATRPDTRPATPADFAADLRDALAAGDDGGSGSGAGAGGVGTADSSGGPETGAGADAGTTDETDTTGAGTTDHATGPEAGAEEAGAAGVDDAAAGADATDEAAGGPDTSGETTSGPVADAGGRAAGTGAGTGGAATPERDTGAERRTPAESEAGAVTAGGAAGEASGTTAGRSEPESGPATVAGIERRRLLQAGGTVAVLAAVGAGAATLLSGGSAAGPDLSAVPERAEAVAVADAGALRSDGTLREAVNAQLPVQAPLVGAGSVEAVLGRIRERTGLDPATVDQVVAFGATGGGPGVYAGLILETDWTDSDLRADLEAASQDLREGEQAGQPIYQASYAGLGFPLAVGSLGDGTYAVGTRPEVIDALAAGAGSAASVSGPQVEALRGTDDGPLRFGTVVPSAAITGAVGGASDNPVVSSLTDAVASIETVAGVVTPDSGDLRLTVRTGSEGDAETVAGQVRVLGRVGADQLVALEGAVPTDERRRLREGLESLSVSRTGTDVTVTVPDGYRVATAGVAVLGALVGR